jgi:uncharacterized protein (DUF433 family)
MRGVRVTGGTVVGQIGAGNAATTFWPSTLYLEREDIVQALRYAATHSSSR